MPITGIINMKKGVISEHTIAVDKSHLSKMSSDEPIELLSFVLI